MTNKQTLLDHIKDHKKEYGFEPSKYDLHMKTGISRSCIDAIFKELIKEGVLQKLKIKRGQYILK